MNKDVHPELGRKTRCRNMEHCLINVRSLHPLAYMEGSTGPERSFWVGRELVGHAWQIRRSNEFWLRVKAELETIPPSRYTDAEKEQAWITQQKRLLAIEQKLEALGLGLDDLIDLIEARQEGRY